MNTYFIIGAISSTVGLVIGFLIGVILTGLRAIKYYEDEESPEPGC